LVESIAGPPVERLLLSDHVYDRIRERIVDGELTPGTRLVELEIARQLGVSQAPVREAIKRLAHEGLVDHQPRRGSYVAEVSETEAEAARDVRAVIEQLAARGLASDCPPELLDALRGLVGDMRAAAAVKDIAAFRDLDLAFHRSVCLASQNPFVGRVWQLMEPSLRGLLVVSNPMFGGSWAAMSNAHDDLIEALSSGEPDRAAEAFHEHAVGHLKPN
jgi:DNA-binding GntR family transcriptional regulator